jgi:peptidoglycan/LPS O-acetylase OafA/YrhL
LTLPRFFVDPSAPPVPLAVASAVATATLTQAWIAPLVPIWSWPTWALSAIVFLYLIMPWLMRALARLTRTQQMTLLAAMPLISLAPTLMFLQFFPDGAEGRQNWSIFIGSTPLFWVPHFAAGMLLSRICRINRFETEWQSQPKGWFSMGDAALVALVAVSLMEPHELPWLYILRHGLLMPLYLIVIRELALGRGLSARFFSLPGMNFLGQLSFSIFIWQNLLMIISFTVAFFAPAAIQASLWIAIVGLLIVSAVSAHLVEKPLAARLRRRPDKATPAHAALVPTHRLD